MSKRPTTDYAREATERALASLRERRRTHTGHNFRKPRPHDRTQRAAGQLLSAAADVTSALVAIGDELSTVGYQRPAGNDSKASGSTSSPVETQAGRSHFLLRARSDITDGVADVERSIDALVRACRRINGDAIVEAVALCGDTQPGREGVGEWGDASCTELPVSRGLCARCYGVERKWRLANGLPSRTNPAG